jgi:hypothetical protein
MASVKKAYAASVDLDVASGLAGLASSATHVAGWESAEIDNTTNLYLDYAIEAAITVESAGLSAGEIRLHLVKESKDGTWPDVFDGTQSAETVTDTEVREAICQLATSTLTDTTASRVYYLSVPSAKAVFGDNLPRKFGVFITQSTGTTLETSGQRVSVMGSYETVA